MTVELEDSESAGFEEESQVKDTSAMGVPRDGEFQSGKVWFSRKSKKTVMIGLTSLAIDEIGEVEAIDFPENGERIDEGEVLASIEGANGSIEVLAPAEGLVTEVNESAEENAEIVSEDPLEEGWLVKFEVQDPSILQEYAIKS